METIVEIEEKVKKVFIPDDDRNPDEIKSCKSNQIEYKYKRSRR